MDCDFHPEDIAVGDAAAAEERAEIAALHANNAENAQDVDSAIDHLERAYVCAKNAAQDALSAYHIAEEADTPKAWQAAERAADAERSAADAERRARKGAQRAIDAAVAEDEARMRAAVAEGYRGPFRIRAYPSLYNETGE